MNHELAKTITTALVQFIDRERPEGTMDCSNGECVSLETAFTEENFDSVETLIKKKLSKLIEFEKCMLDFAKARDEYEFDSTKVVELNNKVIELTKSYARTLLTLAKKNLGWISVNDRLPEVGHFVLTCVEDSGTPQSVGMALLLNDGTWWDGDMKVCVDYWMEVPKLKK